MWCICLHCNHHQTPQDSGLHVNVHLGHLVIIKAKKESSGIRRLWTPLGGGTGRDIHGYTYTTRTREGTYGGLVLSVAAVCELTAFLTAEMARVEPFMHRFNSRRTGHIGHQRGES